LVTIDDGSNMVMLIDTGATHSMISKRFAELKKFKAKEVNGSITSYHGKTESVMTFTGNVGINGLPQLHNRWLVVDLDAIKVERKEIIGVIGMDLLESCGAKIDIKRKIISID
jgi:hypothetical protein